MVSSWARRRYINWFNMRAQIFPLLVGERQPTKDDKYIVKANKKIERARARQEEAERAGVFSEDILKVERAHQDAAHHQHAEAVRRIEDLLVHHQKFRSKLDVVWYQNINRLSVVLKMKHQHASFFLPLNTSKKFRK